MEITLRLSEGVALVSVVGRVDSAVARDWELGLVTAVSEGGGRIVLDCGELSYMSSAGLRGLLVASKKADAEGGQVAVCRVSDRILEILEVSGFVRFLKVFDTVEEACSALGD
ncbi:MAG: STAS domain-containing protein [Gammaproteobacteria bacterium]|nr:STAS domain-containing protein [Gammaproteobacteria bacterium]MDE0273164.1 STAS domain-containing protein [Gammaproteobacteria bacterium]